MAAASHSVRNSLLHHGFPPESTLVITLVFVMISSKVQPQFLHPQSAIAFRCMKQVTQLDHLQIL